MIYYLLKRISKKTGGWCTGMEWRGAYFEKKKKIQVNLLDLLILTQTILDTGLGQYQPPGQVFCTW
jgi:hypothetical protein